MHCHGPFARHGSSWGRVRGRERQFRCRGINFGFVHAIHYVESILRFHRKQLTYQPTLRDEMDPNRETPTGRIDSDVRRIEPLTALCGQGG